MTGGGIISIAGGNLTTHRRMADRVVDLVVERLGRSAGPCRTDTVPLPNGELGPDDLAALGRALDGRISQMGPAGGGRPPPLFRARGRRLPPPAGAKAPPRGPFPPRGRRPSPEGGPGARE